MGNFQEKRHHKRFDFQKPVHINQVLPSKSGNIFEVQEHNIPTQSYNMGEGGLKLEISYPISVGSILKLGFEPGKDEKIEIFAKVIWRQKTECGVNFLAPETVIQKTLRNISPNP